MTVNGFNFAGTGQNMGLVFVKLKPWEERTRPEQKVKAIAQRASKFFATIRDASVIATVPPAVAELGNSSGFDLQLQDRGDRHPRPPGARQDSHAVNDVEGVEALGREILKSPVRVASLVPARCSRLSTNMTIATHTPMIAALTSSMFFAPIACTR